MGNTTINITGGTITGGVITADNIQNSFNTTSVATPVAANHTAPATPAAATGLKTIKIFLASSIELASERDAFELYLLRQNDHYHEQGFNLKVVRWENFLDAVSSTRMQNEYNAAVRDCQIFVSLFATKTGKYTEEEFNVANDHFLKTGLPWIYTFFKETNINAATADRAAVKSLWAFQEKLESIGHFYTHFSSIEDLKLRFSDQLKLLLKPGKLG
jgi:hypothetical protein